MVDEPTACEYALCPCGVMYNRMLKNAKAGTIIEDYGGVQAVVTGVATLGLQLRSTDLLCRARYGVAMVRKLAEWRRDAVYFGNSPFAVSDNECLIITYKKI